MTRQRAGFTLIELLVSAALLASISAGVAIVMSAGLNAWRAGQEHDDFSQQAGAIIDTVTQDLRVSFLGRKGFFVCSEEEPQLYALDCTALSRRTLRLAYLTEKDEPSDENISDLTQVAYYTEPTDDQDRFALYRQEICPPQAEPLAEEDRDTENAQLLSDKVASFELRFCDGQDWLDEWDTATQAAQTSLPAAAEISLTLYQGERQQTYIARVPLFMSVSATGAAQ